MKTIIMSCFITAVLCSSASLGYAATEKSAPISRGTEPQAEVVSIIRLIANPEKYDGKEVGVLGYVSFEFEGSSVYLGKDDYQFSLLKNSLGLSVTENEYAKLGKDFKGYCLIQGTFKALPVDQISTRSGRIENIKRCQKLDELVPPRIQTTDAVR